MELKKVSVRKLTQTEGSNHVCEVMKKNHTKCTTHAAFELEGDRYKYICAFHCNILKSMASNRGSEFVFEDLPLAEDQVSPETRVS
jgi:hypothetical protein